MSATTDLVQRLRGITLESWSVAFETMSEAADAIEALQAERDALLADADRYRWLAPRLFAADWDYQGKCVVVFEWPSGTSISANLDKSIDDVVRAGSKT